MLINLTGGRALFDPSQFEETIVILTSAIRRVSDGDVTMTSREGSQSHIVRHPLGTCEAGPEDLDLVEFVPVFNLLGGLDTTSSSTGYTFVAKSAFRSIGTKFLERTLNFWVGFPTTGGGVVRVQERPDWALALDIPMTKFNHQAALSEQHCPSELVQLMLTRNLRVSRASNYYPKPGSSLTREDPLSRAEAPDTEGNLTVWDRLNQS